MLTLTWLEDAWPVVQIEAVWPRLDYIWSKDFHRAHVDPTVKTKARVVLGTGILRDSVKR